MTLRREAEAKSLDSAGICALFNPPPASDCLGTGLTCKFEAEGKVGALSKHHFFKCRGLIMRYGPSPMPYVMFHANPVELLSRVYS